MLVKLMAVGGLQLADEVGMKFGTTPVLTSIYLSLVRVPVQLKLLVTTNVMSVWVAFLYVQLGFWLFVNVAPRSHCQLIMVAPAPGEERSLNWTGKGKQPTGLFALKSAIGAGLMVMGLLIEDDPKTLATTRVTVNVPAELNKTDGY